MSAVSPTLVLDSHHSGFFLAGVVMGISRTAYAAPQLGLTASPTSLQVLARDDLGKIALFDLWLPSKLNADRFTLGPALIPVRLTIDPHTHALRITVRSDQPVLPAPALLPNPHHGD